MKKIFLIFAMFLLTFAVFADGKKKFAEVSAKHKEEAFKTLDQTFLDVKSLIADNADREKLSATVAKIQSLYKNKESPYRRFLLGVAKICVNLTRFNTALPKEMYRFDPLVAVA